MKTVNNIPQIGLGTFKRNGAEGIAALTAALEVGYRHLDTAQDYNTEAECGEAYRGMGLKREEVFLVTKVSTRYLGEGEVVPSVRRSADQTGVDYFDLVLIHWPAQYDEYVLESYMSQIAEVKALGLAKQIGVSNFPIAYLERSIKLLGEGVIDNNQVEVHPFMQNRKLVDYCQSKGIAVTCYMPIAGGKVSADPVINRIAAKHGATPEQVSLAYLMALDLIVIPSSANKERLKLNFDAQNLTLDMDDMAEMAQLDRGERLIIRDWGPKFD